MSNEPKSYGNQGNALNAIKIKHGAITPIVDKRVGYVQETRDCISCKKETQGIPNEPKCSAICGKSTTKVITRKRKSK
jgi:hypothetical protein